MASRGPSSERKSYTQGPIYLCDTCPTPSGWPLFFLWGRRETPCLTLSGVFRSCLWSWGGLILGFIHGLLCSTLPIQVFLFGSFFSTSSLLFSIYKSSCRIPLFPADVAAWAAAVAAHVVAEWAASAALPGTVLVSAAAAAVFGWLLWWCRLLVWNILLRRNGWCLGSLSHSICSFTKDIGSLCGYPLPHCFITYSWLRLWHWLISGIWK